MSVHKETKTRNLIQQRGLIHVGSAKIADTDIGIVGEYSSGGTKYTGLFRDEDDGAWNLFDGLTAAPFLTDAVNKQGSGFVLAPLNVSQMNAGNVRVDSDTIQSRNGSDLNIQAAGALKLHNPEATAAPTTDLGLATKLYVDNMVQGFVAKQSVVVRTTAAISAVAAGAGAGKTLTASANGAIADAAATIFDDVILEVGDRVLVILQTAQEDNGIYVVTNAGGASAKYVLTRAHDADASPISELTNGAFVFVNDGEIYQNSGWVLQGPFPETWEIDDPTNGKQVWVQFSKETSYMATQLVASSAVTPSTVIANIYKTTTGSEIQFRALEALVGTNTTNPLELLELTGKVQARFDQSKITGTGVLTTGSINWSGGVTTTGDVAARDIAASRFLSTAQVGTGGTAVPNLDYLGARRYKDSVRARSTGDIAGTYVHASSPNTLTGTGTLPAQDGVTLVVGDRVLLAAQTSAQQNGIWQVTDDGASSAGYVLTRTLDADSEGDLDVGSYVLVAEGTTYARTFWMVSTAPTDFSSDPTMWSQVSEPQVYSATNLGDGIGVFQNLNGNEFEFVSLAAGTAESGGLLSIDLTSGKITYNLNQTAITKTGGLTAGSIDMGFGTISTNNSISGASLSTSGSLTFSGFTGSNIISIPDNLSNAFEIKSSDNKSYFRIVTSNGNEDVQFDQRVKLASVLEFTGATTVNKINIPFNQFQALAISCVNDTYLTFCTEDQGGERVNVEKPLHTNDVFSSGDVTVDGNITADFGEISGQSLKTKGTLTFTGGQSTNTIVVPTALNNAFAVSDGFTEYFHVNSTTGETMFGAPTKFTNGVTVDHTNIKFVSSSINVDDALTIISTMVGELPFVTFDKVDLLTTFSQRTELSNDVNQQSDLSVISHKTLRTRSAKDAVLVRATSALSTDYSPGDGTLTHTSAGAIGDSSAVFDGESLVLGDRVLVMNQTNGRENGIYVVSAVGDVSNPWVLTRASDANTHAKLVRGSYVPVTTGPTWGQSLWIVTNPVTDFQDFSVEFTRIGSGTEITELDFTGPSSSNIISFPDGVDDALSFKSADNLSYIRFDTTDGAEAVEFDQDATFSGDVSVDGVLNFTNSTAGVIALLDNKADALSVKEGANAYLTFRTANGTERVEVIKQLNAQNDLVVDGNSSLQGIQFGVVTIGGNATLNASHSVVNVNAGVSGLTITLPPASSHVGRVYKIAKSDSAVGAVTVTPDSTDLIDGENTSMTLDAQYDHITITCHGALGWLIH